MTVLFAYALRGLLLPSFLLLVTSCEAPTRPRLAVAARIRAVEQGLIPATLIQGQPA
jgi:hypothetical protein